MTEFLPQKALRRFVSGLQIIEKRRDSASVLRTTQIPIVAGGMYGGQDAVFSRKKNCCLADFAAGIRRISAKSGEGGGGTCFPSTSLSKSLLGQAEALRCFVSGLQTIEKRRDSTSGLRSARIPIVSGGHGRRFFQEKIATLQVLRSESAEFLQNLEKVTAELASPSISFSKSLLGQAKALRRFVSGPFRCGKGIKFRLAAAFAGA